MTKVVALMSMSLDGYVADANDGVAEVFDWYFSGDVEVPTASTTSGMGVIVASSVTKSGSTVNGVWGRIVVVRTDPGYAPGPGHPGRGTIVASFCG